MNELELFERIRAKAGVAAGQLVVGIGDDCAVFRPKGSREDLLFTTDLMVEGVHFRKGDRPEHLGHKALARGLSDIAAMGGKPQFCLISVALPRTAQRILDRFYDGLLRLAQRTGTTLAGGDLSRSNQITFDIVVCGSAPRGKALLRSTARPGDRVWVSGPLGRAAARGYRDSPVPRLQLGKQLRGLATSCMDLSDGISIDLHRLCLASQVSAELSHIPVAPGATLENALHGGEDYELLFTAPPGNSAPSGCIQIGTILAGEAGSVTWHGNALDPRGHDHFRS